MKTDRYRALRHVTRVTPWSLYVITIVFALAIQAWGTIQWPTNFDSDEAIFALMARHALQGDFSVYMYGQSYLGSLETLFAAAVMAVFGSTVGAFRSSALVLFSIFLILHSILVQRHWGHKTAFYSLLLLAVPGRLMYIWLYRPITGLHIIFVLGTALLLISTIRTPSKKLYSYLLVAAAGLMIGLGLWSHPMFVIYIATFFSISLLQLPEWEHVREKIGLFSGKNSSLTRLLTVLTIMFAGLGVVAFFTSGCEPRNIFSVAQTTSRLLILGLITILGLIVLLVSTRPVELLSKAGILGATTLLGNLPQWGGWLFASVEADAAIRPSCPTGATSRSDLIGGQLLPALWGIPGISEIVGMPILQKSVWFITVLVVCIALGVFVWIGRSAWRSLITLSPIKRADRGPLIIGLLLGLPILLVALGGNTIDALSSRYLLIAWTVCTVPLALLVNLLFNRAYIAIPLIILWIGFVGGSNMKFVDQIWTHQGAQFTSSEIRQLEAFFQENDVQGGYADYWITYPISFLTQERITLSPFNGIDRYNPYTRSVQKMKLRAYILYAGNAPEDTSTIGELITELRSNRQGLVTFRDALPEKNRQSVQKRQTIGKWDVWIVGPSSQN